MEKIYQVIEEYDLTSFEQALNAIGKDGYAVMSHSVTFNSEHGNFVYTAVLAKYGSRFSYEDHIQQIISKLDSIESNTIS